MSHEHGFKCFSLLYILSRLTESCNQIFAVLASFLGTIEFDPLPSDRLSAEVIHGFLQWRHGNETFKRGHACVLACNFKFIIHAHNKSVHITYAVEEGC